MRTRQIPSMSLRRSSPGHTANGTPCVAEISRAGPSNGPGPCLRPAQRTHDPVKAFATFARCVGVDASDVRDDRDSARERLELAIELLVHFTPLRDIAPKPELAWGRILEALADTSGPDPLAMLRGRVEQVENVARLHRLGLDLEGSTAELAVRLREQIRAAIAEDPLGEAPEDISQGIDLAQRLKSLLDRVATLRTPSRRTINGYLRMSSIPWSESISIGVPTRSTSFKTKGAQF